MQDKQYFMHLSIPEINHAIKDIQAAMRLAATWQDKGVGENKYADQLHAALAAKKKKTALPVCPYCQQPRAH